MEEHLRKYFFQNMTYNEIACQLFMEIGIQISVRHLKRIIKRLGLRRRGNFNMHAVYSAMKTELEGSGSRLGCRMMVHRLLAQYGLSVGRDTVMKLMHLIDPEGVQMRKRHHLSRRLYVNKGPNFLIHIDGYDKLKRFGFAIHGAICGFSRKVLWLEVARTNNDPKVVASYFLQYVKENQGVPRCIRVDAGTENVVINDLQEALRSVHGDECSQRSVIIGSSHSNQRIEAWWRQMRQLGVGFWIDFFYDLENMGFFSTSSEMHIECLRFCFNKLIQADLDRIKQEWNQHRVRQSTPDSPSGKPLLLYQYPELYGAVDYMCPVQIEDIEILEAATTKPSKFGCLHPQLYMSLMTDNGRQQPVNKEEAFDLFCFLIEQLNS